MKKKFMTALLCAAMAVSMLGGCGSNEKDSGQMTDINQGGDVEGNNAKEENEEENPLTVWCWDSKFNIYAMEEASIVYQAEHPEFTMNIVETSWDDIQSALITAAGDGAMEILPDIILIQDNAFQKNVISFPEIFMDLTDSGIDFSQFGQAKTLYSVIDGKNYGVPFDNGAAIACYRTDILKEAGLTLDDFTDINWEEYLEMGKIVLEKTGRPLLSCQSGEPDVIMMMLQSCGVSIFDDDGNPQIVGNEALEKAMEIYQQMIEAGVCKLVNSWDEYVQTLTAGTAAGTINGCWIMASIQSAEDQSGKWGLTNIPRLAGIDGATNYSNNGGASWAITANCRNPEPGWLQP